MTFVPQKGLYEIFVQLFNAKKLQCAKKATLRNISNFPVQKKESQGTKNFTNSKSIYEGKDD